MRKSRRFSPSFLAVLVLAFFLPVIAQLITQVTRNLAGAEGRLAAITINTEMTLGPMQRTWSGLAQGADNLTGFMTESKNDLSLIKPEYIRIDHIYDQFPTVYRESGGDVSFDWVELDKVVDDIASAGAKPFFSLSYMPLAISKNGILDEPKNWDEWSLVIQRTIEHYSGAKALENVYYEVWNEPDLFGEWKIGGKKDYRKLYYYALQGAKRANNVMPYKIGGPATTGLYKNWVDTFLPFILENNLRLDFYSWHRYSLNLDQVKKDAMDVTTWLDRHPYFDQVEKIITEYGPNSDMGKENDLNIGAAHLVAMNRELMGKTKLNLAFAVWGKWGVLGKPRGKAMEFLERLGSFRLPITGEGTWVKAIAGKDKNTYSVVVVNYDEKDNHIESVPVTFTGLLPGKYKFQSQTLSEELKEIEIATSAAIWQTTIYLPKNQVVYLELSRI